MNALYPYEESAKHIAGLFGNLALVLLIYGLVTLGSVLFKKKMAVPVNMFMNWLVIPCILLFLFLKHWQG